MISPADVRGLLQSEEKNAVPVVIEGRVEVIGAGRLASADYRRGLEVTSAATLCSARRDAVRPRNRRAGSATRHRGLRVGRLSPAHASISPTILRSMLARVVAGSTMSPSSSFCARE